ncbi:hypothetical protein RvY_01411-2 [Ramazzottius varieornatus]|uniref:Metalloendopeptidase OMA1, mitochondrial n=1 Tax=Ramazzottius varieornatus TaxID=947166 RepID=A0A1D1UGK6_RAMVA|nr:hypothetical protein RvY_01411-2 [Ramazzottius varieornatus]
MFTIDQFEPLIEMEKDMLFHVLKGTLLPTDHTAYKTVQNVITQILKENANAPNVRQRKWRISVVESEQQNAFVMPTGHIFVFSGILEIAKNENQLAVVLGHELSHALLDHVVELHSLQFCTEVGALAFVTWLWSVLASKWVAFFATVLMYKAIKVAFILPRHRLLEREADTVGLNLTAKACFDVRENSVFWTRMQLLGAISDKAREHHVGDTARTILSYLSTHPSHEERANLLNAATPKVLAYLHTVLVRSSIKAQDKNINYLNDSFRL